MKVSSFLDIAGPSTQVACYWFTDYQVKVNQSRTQNIQINWNWFTVKATLCRNWHLCDLPPSPTVQHPCL